MSFRSFSLSKEIAVFAILSFFLGSLSAESYDLRSEFEAFMARDPLRLEKLLNVPPASQATGYAQEINPNDLPNFFAMVNRLAARMAVDMPQRVMLSFNIGDNAFAAPLAIINLTKLLCVGNWFFRNSSDEEIEALMAHELAHIKFRHIEKRIVNIFISVLICSSLGGALYSAAVNASMSKKNSYIATVIGCLMWQFVFSLALLRFIMRKQEKEADLEAIKNLENPHGLIKFFRRIEPHERLLPWVLRIFSTHPTCQERIAYIQAALAEKSN